MKRSWRFGRGFAAVLVACALIATAVGWNHLRREQRASNERFACAMLKTLATANAQFRGDDLDRNGVQDYWTADVAGLHHLLPPGESTPLRLIEEKIASADPTRAGAKAAAGYWFRAIERDETGAPYAGPGSTGRNRGKFGFCAYPAEYGRTGIHTFMINEGNTVFKQDLKGEPKRQWPPDAELKFQYSLID